MWDDQIESLTEHFNVLRYDTRGHGGTDAPSSDYSIDIFVEDAVSLLDKSEYRQSSFCWPLNGRVYWPTFCG